MSSTPTAFDHRTATPGKSVIGGMLKWVVAICVLWILFPLLLAASPKNATEIPFSTFDTELNNGRVTEITIGSNEVSGTLSGPGVRLPDGTVVNQFRTHVVRDAASNWGFIQYINQNRGTAEVRIEDNDNPLLQVLLPLIPWVLIFFFIWFFVFRQLRRAQTAAPKAIAVYQVPPPLNEPRASA